MRKDKNKEKIDTKKAFYSVLSMIILILSVSYFFQSCDASLIPSSEDGSTVDLIDDYITGDDETSQGDENQNNDENYFIFDVAEKLKTDRPTLYVENYENESLTIEITEFYEERDWGWAFLSGFADENNTGIYTFEIEDNCIIFSVVDPLFNATIDFNNCWQDSNYLYSNIEINGVETTCYTVLE